MAAGMRNAESLWRTVWQFLIRLNIHSPYNLAFPLLGVYPREVKTYVCTYACGSFIHNCPKLKTTQMFVN